MNRISYVINKLPPSLNNATRIKCWNGKPRKYSSKQLQEWNEQISVMDEKVIEFSMWYQITLLFKFPILTKKGDIRKKDIDNMIKYSLDAFLRLVYDSDGNQIDDSRIIRIIAKKKYALKDQTYFELKPYC